MRLAFVLNPAARNGRAGRVRDDIEAALKRRGLEPTIVETREPKHATELAAALAGSFDAIVAVGGDGTAHEVARGLFGTSTAMGALAEGTGNDFAQALGMPKEVDAAIGALLDAPVKPVDVGRVRWTESASGDSIQKEALFVNCLGAGFDGLVATLVPRYKWMGGNLAYLTAVFRALNLWKKPYATVNVGDDPLYAGPLYFISVCNGFSIGGGFLMTPEAEIDDGRLDLCLVRGMPVLRVLRLLPKTFSGAHVGAPEVEIRRLERLTARSEAPLPMQLDGEVATTGAESLEVDVLPGAINALMPGRR
jgi:YegS/Rv2252/BmrU family lipid kinase